MKYFKILTQINDPDPVIIDETELVKAIQGQLTGNPAVFKTASLSGSMIKNSKIIPDFDRALITYNRENKRLLEGHEHVYAPDATRLPSEVKQLYFLAIENAGEIVKARSENRAPQLREPVVRVHTQGMKQIGDLLPKQEPK